MESYPIIMFLGSMDLRTFSQIEDGEVVTYGYSIERDFHGREISRTAPERLCSFGWDSGKQFTSTDLEKLLSGS